jgi:CHAT domain-containing protein/tetratricopeptide (TPR) repeat protein
MALDRIKAGIVAGLLLLGAGLLSSLIPPLGKAPSPAGQERHGLDRSPILKPGTTLSPDIRGGETHTYSLPVAPGEIVRAVLDPQGTDLVLRLAGSSGTEHLRIVTAHGFHGPETAYVTTEMTAAGKLEISSGAPKGRGGRYVLKLERSRSVTPEDGQRIAAMRAFARGERFFARDEAAFLKGAAVQYNQALGFWEQAGEQERASATRYRLGRTLQRLFLWGSAHLVHQEALKEVRSRGDRLAEACLLDRLGRGFLQSGKLEEARDAFERSLMLFRSEGYRPGEADALANLGLVQRRRGDNQEGLKLALLALEAWRALGGRREQSTLLNNVGELYVSLGQPELALDSFNEALEIDRAIQNRRGEASALRGRGTALMELGQTGQSLSALKRSVEIFASLEAVEGEVTSRVRLGDVYARAGRLPEARALYERALSLAQQGRSEREQAMALGNLGHVLDLLGREQEALIRFDQASLIFEKLGDMAAVPKVVYGRAEAARDLGDLEAARVAVEKAIRGFEALRNPGDRVASFPERRRYYELYVELLMRLHERTPGRGFDVLAYEASEAARSLALLDEVREMRAGLRAGDPELVARKSELERRMSALELRRSTLPEDDPEVAVIDREIRGLKAPLAIVDRELQDQVLRERPQPLKLQDIQRNLDQDTVLLTYFLGAERSFLWEVTADRCVTHELPQRSEIEPLAEQVWKKLARNPPPNWREWMPAVIALSRTLLSPVAGQRKRRLLVSPDGALYLIPFAALLDPRTLDRSGRPGDEPDAPRFMVLDFEIMTVPSISRAVASRVALKDRPPAVREVAILADPVFGSNDGRVRIRTEARRLEAKFERLLHTIDEAKAIMAVAPPGASLLATGFQASRATVTDPAIRRSRIIHIASHGWLRDRPDLSGVVLSLLNERGEPQDGFLRAFEVDDLHLSSDLVVLSACETGLGGEEGGLVRGFLNAGAKQVLPTLWSVKDRSTARLMDQFYKGLLGQRMSAPAALRQAQVDLLRSSRWPSPHYWAGFVLQGDWR